MIRAPINWTDGLVAALFCFSMWHIVSDKAESMAAERDDRELCTAELGPGAQVLRTHQGDLVCRPAELTAGGQP